MERTLRLLVLLAVIAIPRAVPSEDGSTGRADAGGLGYGPTEFLERWDRRYRLIDPEVESGPQPAERDYARAASELKKAILTGIADDQMYYRLGYCYEKMGDYDRALEAYLRAGERLRAGEDTGDLAFYLPFHLGLVHAKKGNCGDAVKEFERAHETGKDSAPLRNNLGYCYNRIYLKRRAIEEFQRAAALDPQCAAVFLNMGITQAELGDLVGAEASLRRALEINPRIEGGNYNLGLVLCTKGERGEAEEALRSAVADSPDDEKARLALAKLCATLGKNAEAREHARVAFSLDPALKAGNPELCALGKGRASGTEDKERGEQVGEREYLARAQRRIAQGDLRGAGELYDAILERNPKSIQACLGLAYVNEFAGGRRYGTGFPAEECISLYRRAIEIQPRSGVAWCSLGNVYEKLGRYEDAVQAFSKARELSPDMEHAWYSLGVCYKRLGDKEKAEEHFRKAVALHPGFEEAHFQLGMLCAERRDFAGAIEEYRIALTLDPEDADAHFNLAQIYRKQAEKPREAIEHFRAYLSLRPHTEERAAVEGWIKEMQE